MRNATARALGILPVGGDATPSVIARLKPTSSHPGLVLERCAPIEYSGEQIGRVPPEFRDTFLDSVASVRIPAIYKAAFLRWKTSLSHERTVLAEVRTTSRLLVGHGISSGVESGIELHPTYGVPWIPGSSLKGVLNHYMSEEIATLTDVEAWKGVEYDEKGSPAGPPGRYHGTLFGAPAFRDAVLADGSRGDLEARRSAVVFEDAWLIPDEGMSTPLIRDVLTPHQMAYYTDRADSDGPIDWDQPNPVSFLTVRPGARFLIGISVREGVEQASRAVANMAMKHLCDALAFRGIGAKTRAGYGRLVQDNPTPGSTGTQRGSTAAASARDVRPTAPSSEALTNLEAAVAYVLTGEKPGAPKGDVAPSISERFNEHFAGDNLIDLLKASELPAAFQIMRRIFDHNGLKKRQGDRIAALKKRLQG